MDLSTARERLTALAASNFVVRIGSTDRKAVQAIQTALLAAGHELIDDGDFGGITRTAVRQFQAARKLVADGEAGPLTLGLLLDVLVQHGAQAIAPPLPSVLAVAPHLARMRAMTGIKEMPGRANNPLIISWVLEISRRYPDRKVDLDWYKEDSIPWCGLGMGAATAIGDPSFEPPRSLLAAISWARWGQGLSQPTPGAVLVFTRTGGNHVTLYESEDESYYYCRGANQSDMVNCSRRGKSQKPLAVRWPPGLPLPKTGRKFGPTLNAVAAGAES